MAMTTSVSITPGQEKQLKRFVADAAERAVDSALKQAVVDPEGMQRIFARGDDLQAAVEPVVLAKLKELSVTNKYANEEVPSKYVYPPTYRRRSITEQTNRLRELIPGAGYADEKLAELPLLPGAEWHFAILRWQSVAPTYGEACEKLLAIAKTLYKGKFKNWLEGQLGPGYLRQGQRSAAKYRELGEQQKGYDILVVQGQLGLRHAGCSPRRADERFLGNEFGLGLFGNLCIILTHPERLSTGEELWMDCTGDERSPGADGQFESVPYLNFNDGGFQLGNNWFDDAIDDYGSSSGFLPQ